MKRIEFASISLKVLGIYSLFEFLATLPTAFSLNPYREIFGSMDPEFGPLLAGSIASMQAAITSSCFIYLILSIVLLTQSEKLARWFVRTDDTEVDGKADAPERDSAGRFVIQLMGVYALIFWLPNLVQTLTRTIIFGSWQVPQIPPLQRFYDNGSLLIEPVFGTLLGLFLVFRSNGVTRILNLARPLKELHSSTEKSHHEGEGDSA